ncbi:MAG: ATP-binding protein [Candidatus Aminicenantes bacterium]|nr:ATP-binding protein [Candidatus Aminicenantes bacterium]
MAFIDRERELGALEKFWKGKEAQLIVIYGKRRIGKTELIKQFIKGKPHVYYLAQRINERENLRLLGEAVGDYYKDDILKSAGFREWRWFFEYAQKHIRKRTIIVFDEFPYLADANKGISSIFQAGWDEHLKNIPVFLILCGSSIGMMENEVLSQKAPLFGRRTGQIFLQPFSFADACKFYPGLSFERCLELFSVAGGNPSYLKRFDPKISLDRNIHENILRPETFLYDEVEFILREELREPRNYFAILKAVALGKHKFGEIVNETGLAKSNLHKYLFILEDLRLIQKEIPVTEKNPLKSRKGIYKLQDQFIRFWFRYVLPNKRNIEEGTSDYVLKKIKDDFYTVVADNFETVCRDIIDGHKDKLFLFEKIGRWWHKNEEIDLIAVNDEEKKILFGEAKWSKKPVGVDIYDNLKRKSRLVDWNKDERTEYFCLFSKSGFTENLLKRAEKEQIVLFQKDRLFE